MTNQPASFMLLPSFTHVPNAGLRLGTLIPLSNDTKLPDPGVPLNEYTCETPPSRHLHESTEASWTFASGKYLATPISVDGDLSVFAPGASIGYERSKSNGIRIRCRRVDTEHFSPDLEYISRALREPFVKEFCSGHRRRTIFLVTGLKVAHGAQIEMDAHTSFTGWFKIFAGSLALTGVPVNLGTSLQLTSGAEFLQTSTIDGPFILAYQLIKLSLKKDGSAKKSEAYNKYALFDDTMVPFDDTAPSNVEMHWDLVTVVEGLDFDS